MYDEEVEVSYQREYLFCICASYFRVLLAVAFMIAPFDLTHGLKSFCDEAFGLGSLSTRSVSRGTGRIEMPM